MSNLKKKRIRKIAVIIIVSIAAAMLIIPNMIYRINEKLVEQETIVEDLDISYISEKTLSGSYQSGHMSAGVEVTIVNGQYVDITLTDYAGINPSRARKVINAIMEYQTLTPEFEDIGTQYTDIIVQKAIYYAIRYNYSVG